MKRYLLVLLALLLALGILGCRKADPQPSGTDSTLPPAQTEPSESTALFTFPKNTVVFGVKIGGMNAQKAQAAVEKAVDSYALSAQVGSDHLRLSAKDLKLQFSEAEFGSYVQALEAGKQADASRLFSFDEAAAFQAVSKALSKQAKDAAVVYHGGKQKFIIQNEISGVELKEQPVRDLLTQAVCAGSDTAVLDDAAKIQKPSLFAKDEAVRSALEQANSLLDLKLTYTYTPDGKDTSKQKLSRDDLAALISFGKDMTLTVSDKAARAYASRMSDRFSAPDYQDSFQTTGGGSIGYSVDYYGQKVNTDALAADLAACVADRVSGERKAPYHALSRRNEKPYGGDYVEINLSDQHLWVYRGGEQVVSTPLVSGCVAEGHMTPTGIYAVQDRDTDCTLSGDDYETHVDYWVGFYGGYGIHDAPWRWAFGEDIYLYDGSHGCANLPPYQAQEVHANTELGMKVVVYGGETEVDPLKQEILCQKQFDVADDAKPFQLGAEPKYGDVKLTYQSSNPKVAKVSENGTVTVTGIGKTTVTITAPAFTYHTDAKTEVTVTVHSACEDGRHKFGQWKQTLAPTCGAPGEETRTCSKCGHTETREIPATGEHNWGPWITTKAPSCQSGEETRTCLTCGQTETREIPPVSEHTPGQWTVVVEPGCETPGLRQLTCTQCGQVLEEEEIPPIGHAFSPDEPYCLHGCGTPNPDYNDPALPPKRRSAAGWLLVMKA